VISHLDYLKVWPGKKAIVMPCLIELSKASKEIHYKIGKKIGKVCDLAIIVTKERFKEIKKGALEGGLAKENILFLEKPKEILEKISSFLKQKEDVVLLEGRISKEIIEKLIL
jgi:UDP-N-acetylmuramoyl-tripeptide--D-alanyl-D-alanine ligase